mgnify:CR=1 FL=1
MRSLSFLGWALLAACSPKNVYTDDLDTADSLVDSQDTGEVPVPSFEGIWKGNELRFLTRNGGFDENGNPIVRYTVLLLGYYYFALVYDDFDVFF